MSLWQGVEQVIKEGMVETGGICDLTPPVFINLYEAAVRKPDSVQINLKSCCVVPEELSNFAKEHKVALITVILPHYLLYSKTET